MFKDVFDNSLHLTDKFTGHRYLDTYDEVFGPRKLTAKNILEIGVDQGGSLLLWRDFFPNANIYGLDIKNNPPELDKYSKDRITYINQNAYDVNCVRENFEYKGMQFDIIIDDGPHSLESMLFFVEHYSVILAPGGVMVIEDIPAIEWTSQIMDKVPAQLKSKSRAVDLRHIQNRWDDILFIIEK